MVIYDACYVLTYVAVMLGSQLTIGSYVIQESDCRQIGRHYVRHVCLGATLYGNCTGILMWCYGRLTYGRSYQ
jgi:hypothetical protein